MVKVEDYMEFEWSDDILIARYISDQPLNEEIARALVKARLDFANNQPHKVVIAFPKLSAIPKDAREYLSSEEAQSCIIASAMVTPTLLSKMIINFFLTLVRKNGIENQLFDTEAEALFWIKQLK